MAGSLRIELDDQTVELELGELFIVPKGVDHLPTANGEAHVLLIDPKTVPNTGDKITKQTVETLLWI